MILIENMETIITILMQLLIVLTLIRFCQVDAEAEWDNETLYNKLCNMYQETNED